MIEHRHHALGVYYRTGGERHRQVVVLIHGLSGSSSAWVEFEESLEQHFFVVSFDLRGHGYSHRPQEHSAYTPQAMAQECKALLDDLGVAQPYIIGHSLGSLVLFEFLRLYPQYASKIVFLSPEYDVSRRLLPRIASLFLSIVPWLELWPAAQPTGGHVVYAPRYRGTGDWNLFRMYADIRATGVRSFLYATYHAFHVRCAGVASTVTCPVLLVHGERDTIFPVVNTRELVNEFPRAEMYILPDADHILVLNHAQEILPRIHRFFTDS